MPEKVEAALLATTGKQYGQARGCFSWREILALTSLRILT